MMRLSHKHALHMAQRSGFSLIEVILATAILMGSVVVLGELAGIGRRQAQRGRDLSVAHEKCEQLLNEILLGLKPLTPIEQEPLLDTIEFSEQLDIDFGNESFDEYDPFAPDENELTNFSSELDTGESEADWLYSVFVEPLPERPGLALLRVSIEQSPEKFPRPLRFELSRWIEDPSPQDESEFGTIGTQREITSVRKEVLP